MISSRTQSGEGRSASDGLFKAARDVVFVFVGLYSASSEIMVRTGAISSVGYV